MPEGEADDDPDGRATVGVAFGPQYGPVTAQAGRGVRPRREPRAGTTTWCSPGSASTVRRRRSIEEAAHPKLRIHMAHIRPGREPRHGRAAEGDSRAASSSPCSASRGRRLDRPDKDGEYTVTMEGVDIYNPVDNTSCPTGRGQGGGVVPRRRLRRADLLHHAGVLPRPDGVGEAGQGAQGRRRRGAIRGAERARSRCRSRPGSTGGSAVKVIDPRGNEVMRVRRAGRLRGDAHDTPEQDPFPSRSRVQTVPIRSVAPVRRADGSLALRQRRVRGEPTAGSRRPAGYWYKTETTGSAQTELVRRGRARRPAAGEPAAGGREALARGGLQGRVGRDEGAAPSLGAAPTGRGGSSSASARRSRRSSTLPSCGFPGSRPDGLPEIRPGGRRPRPAAARRDGRASRSLTQPTSSRRSIRPSGRHGDLLAAASARLQDGHRVAARRSSWPC